MNYFKIIRTASFFLTLTLVASAVYRSTYLGHTATYQDLTFYVLLMVWLCTVITIKEDEIRTSAFSVKCVSSGLFFMLIPELTPFIDSRLESILGGMSLAITSGKPMDFLENLSTGDFYAALYSAQACILMLTLLIGTLKLKGVKKYAPKRKAKKKKRLL
ncbi:hypothetical protein QTV49_001824 [Vibrio vulnificus]|nr:hypothetical protein [Vibrio vulnificus]